MTVYTALAQVYDALTDDVPYAQWVAFAQGAFEQYGRQPHLVLDLACGTGSLTKLLGQAGYEMIAADLSPEMLAVAREKCSELPCPPVFLCQDMRELDLYGTIDAAVCGLDSLNYLIGAAGPAAGVPAGRPVFGTGRPLPVRCENKAGL